MSSNLSNHSGLSDAHLKIAAAMHGVDFDKEASISWLARRGLGGVAKRLGGLFGSGRVGTAVSSYGDDMLASAAKTPISPRMHRALVPRQVRPAARREFVANLPRSNRTTPTTLRLANNVADAAGETAVRGLTGQQIRHNAVRHFGGDRGLSIYKHPATRYAAAGVGTTAGYNTLFGGGGGGSAPQPGNGMLPPPVYAGMPYSPTTDVPTLHYHTEPQQRYRRPEIFDDAAKKPLPQGSVEQPKKIFGGDNPMSMSPLSAATRWAFNRINPLAEDTRKNRDYLNALSQRVWGRGTSPEDLRVWRSMNPQEGNDLAIGQAAHEAQIQSEIAELLNKLPNR